MKRPLQWLAIAAAVAPLGFVLGTVALAQRADYGWRPRVERPAFTRRRPIVVVDQAHNNASTAGAASRFWPFARLLRADGCEVRKGTRRFETASLDGVDVLVVANASGAPRPQFLGINLPVRGSNRERGDPAFTADEIGSLRAWVERGGSLLFIADHAPFGAAAAALAETFGVTMYQGFVEVPGEVSDPLEFSRANGRLGDHPILAGAGPEGAVRRVMTFTGQSLAGPSGAAVLLRLPENAVEYVASGPDLVPRPAGPAQGLALEVGRGRVVVLGEAGMVTAQVDRLKPFGMNTPGNDNRIFALNVVRWLARGL